MTLYIYDQGYRIQTPKDALFKEKGVDSLNRSRHSHRNADMEDRLHADGEKFVIPGPYKGPENNDNVSRAYESNTADSHNEVESPQLTVAKIMVTPVHSVTPNTPITTTWQRMQSLEISHLIVMEEDERPLGLIHKTDLAAAGTDSLAPIKSLCTRKLTAAIPETLIQDVAMNFIENDLNAIPVVNEEDKVVGIVCRTDLLRLLVSGPHLERWV